MQTRNQTASMDYITRTFVREPNYLAPIRAEGERRRPGMQVSSYEGHLLNWLVRICNAKRILEIGTFMAYSTLWMAEALPADGRITTLEFDASHAEQATKHIKNSPHAQRVELVQGDALSWIAKQPQTPTYDLVFIDADKKSYATYLEYMIPRMNPHALIIGDNSLLFGAMAGEAEPISQPAYAAMMKFNDMLADPSRFEGILLPTLEGLTVARLKN